MLNVLAESHAATRKAGVTCSRVAFARRLLCIESLLGGRVAGGNMFPIASVPAIAGPLVRANVSGNPGLAMLAWFALPVYLLGFLAWPAGLFMVWNARA